MPRTSIKVEIEPEEALVAIIECVAQAKHDWCGEQRDWHLPRVNKVLTFLMQRYPSQTVDAMQKAMTPYGDKLMKDDDDE